MGGNVAVSNPPHAGDLIATRYHVLEELGRGGAARVYRVLDEASGAELALKRRHGEAAVLESRRAALFRHEYHTLKLLSHPGIVSVHDYGVADGRAYYTMELISGQDVYERAPVPFVEACSLLRDVASSLAMLHARRVLHRDISYRNVRCTPEGRAKLIDFGAMMAPGTPTEVIGTPPFLAPEALACARLDQRTDLYSFGALAYWMLTRKHAYPAGSAPVLRQLWAHGAPHPPSSHAPDIPAELDHLVMSLLSLDPEHRPTSAAEVMDRLSAIGGLPPDNDLCVAEAYLATPTLVGRKRQLSRIRKRLLEREARDVLVIEGAEGTGKSRILEELLIEAELHGTRAIRAAGERSAAVPYGVIRRIVTQLTAELDHVDSEISASDRTVLSTEFPTLLPGGPQNLESPIPAGELRHRMHGALLRWLTSLATRRRVLVLVDDLHRVDDESASVLAALAASKTNDLCLAVAMPRAVEGEPAAMRLLRKSGATVTLRELSADDTEKLVTSLFGDVPNVTRLAHWMYERTRGNPLGCSTLAQHLVERDIIRYMQGTWVIPAELPSAVPGGLLATRKARIDTLSSGQRAVAEALSIFDVATSMELCAAVAEVGEDEAFEALDVLVRLEVAALQGGAYVYRVEALRSAVAGDIAPIRLPIMHERAGRLLREHAGLDLNTKIRAAHHLLRGTSRREGAELVLAIASDADIDRDIGHHFTEPLELTLDLMRSEGRPPTDTIPLLHRLLNAAFLYDRTLVHHAEALLPQLKHDAGLDLLTGTELASPDWMPTALERARSRHDTEVAAARGFAPEKAVRTIAGISGITLAAAILNWDIPLIERIWELAAPLAALGHASPLAAVPELVGMYVGGLRIGEASEHEQRLAYIERLRDPGMYVGMHAGQRESVLSTQLHNVGMATSMFDSEAALALADEIDGLGMHMYAGAAVQIRYMVHMYRGEADRARDFREELDLLALEGGAGAQFELWLAPYLADPYALWGDVMGLKHACAHLERLADGFVGYVPMALIARGHYHRERKQLGPALACFERAREAAPRDRHGAWLLALSGHVDTLVAMEDYEQARTLVTEVFDSLHYRERFCSIVRRRLAPGLASALAGLDHCEEASALLEDEIANEAENGRSPLLLGRLHEIRARVALRKGDAEAFKQHAAQVEAHFRGTRNPILISRHERLLADAQQLAPLRDVADSDDGRTAHTHTYLEMVRAPLAGLSTMAARAGCMLSLLERETGSGPGYMYLMRDGHLTLIAPSEPEHGPPDGLSTLLSDMIQGVQDDDDDLQTETHMALPEAGTTVIAVGEQAFVPHRLSAWLDGDMVMVGVAALPMRPDHSNLPEPDLLHAIAQTLYEQDG